MSSRLERSASGRAVRAIVTAPDVGLPVGTSFVVLGDALFCAEPGFYFTGTRTPPAPPVKVPRRRGSVGARPTPRKWSDAEREHGRELVASGLSWAQAAERVGCSKTTLAEWVKGAGRGVNTPAASISATPAPSVTVGEPAPVS